MNSIKKNALSHSDPVEDNIYWQRKYAAQQQLREDFQSGKSTAQEVSPFSVGEFVVAQETILDWLT